MRAIGMGAIVAAVFASATGSASGQEAVPPLPGMAEAGSPAASSGPSRVPDREAIAPPPVPDAEPLASPSSHGAESSEESQAAPQGQTPAARETTSDSPGGSRLLRALAESTGQDGRAAEVLPFRSGARVLAAEGCPRALLRRLLADAAGESDALAALAIETEVLTLCSERQRIVTALFETEARLNELRAPAEPVPAVETATAVSPAPAVLETERETPATPAEPAADPAPSAMREVLAADSGEEEKIGPSLGWFSILGSAGALRAGITDGTGVWFVREGDALPGGGTVAGIAGRPPSVRATGPDGDAEEPLPFRPRPGGRR